MKWIIWILIILVLGSGIAALVVRDKNTAPVQTDNTPQQERSPKQAIREQVISFGDVLKNVSLLSPTAAADIEREYAPFVTRSLRTSWEAHPDSALGRMTSSPWPERIDVTDIEQSGETYQVSSVLVYKTSAEVDTEKDAGSADLVLIMKEEDSVWKIDSVQTIRQNAPNTRSDESRPALE